MLNSWPDAEIITLFDRAATRDSVDVYILSSRYSITTHFSRAQEIDAGFDRRVLAEMMGLLNRCADEDLSLGDADVPALRSFFRRCQADLMG